MNKWDDLRWSDMNAAKRRLELDFDRLSQLAGRSFSLEAQEEILEASRQFIEDAFCLDGLPAKDEMRLCQRIVTKIDKYSNGTFTQEAVKALWKLLKEADGKGLVLSNGVVQRAIRRLDDSDILKELRAAALRRIGPPQVAGNANTVVIESENTQMQMVEAGFIYGRSGAKSYTPLSLFASVLYRVYCEAGGTARYTHRADNSFSGEAIDFIIEAVAQVCLVFSKEMADSVRPFNQGSAIAKAIKNYFKNNA